MGLLRLFSLDWINRHLEWTRLRCKWWIPRLFRAIRCGNVERAAAILKRDEKRDDLTGHLMSRHEPGAFTTPLMAAVQEGSHEMLELLLSKVDPRSWEDTGADRAISDAAASGKSQMVRLLLARFPLRAATGVDSNRPLHWAAQGGHQEVVRLLLAKGVSVNSLDNLGRTALHYAVLDDHEAVVKTLIEAGADITTKDVEGKSPLNFHPVESVKRLLLSHMSQQTSQPDRPRSVVKKRVGQAGNPPPPGHSP